MTFFQLCQAVLLQLVNRVRARFNFLVQLQRKLALGKFKWQPKLLQRKKFLILNLRIRLLRARRLVTKFNHDNITPISHHRILIKLIQMQVRIILVKTKRFSELLSTLNLVYLNKKITLIAFTKVHLLILF